MSAVTQVLDTTVGQARRRLLNAAGGPARLQIVLVMASVMSLDSADKATVSAVAGSLKQAFHVNDAGIGLLIAVASFSGAILTMPVGNLVDRIRRNRILLIAVAIWSIAMAVSGFSTSFLFMLATRICLGAITAAAFPAVASMVGDFIPASDRARTYGMILTGELIGVGVGFFISGVISAWVGWRWPFFVMAALGAGVVWVLWRYLPEPARGGQDWLAPGQRKLPRHEKTQPQQQSGPAASAQSGKPQPSGSGQPNSGQPGSGQHNSGQPGSGQPGSHQSGSGQLQEEVLEADIPPREHLVLHQDPSTRSLWWAIRYVVHIPTYLLLVLGSSLAYFFFGGIRGFAMIYFTGHYGVSRTALSGLVVIIGIGAIAGMVLGGALSEKLLQRGWFATRVVVPGIALLACIAFFGAGVWTTDVVIGVPLLTIGAAMLAAANPSYDAARLDVMHPRLWGRAESGRMMIRAVFEGGAPLLFGLTVMWLGGGQAGLKWTFLVMLIPLAIAASLAIPARRTYPRDVATAGASARETAKSGT